MRRFRSPHWAAALSVDRSATHPRRVTAFSLNTMSWSPTSPFSSHHPLLPHSEDSLPQENIFACVLISGLLLILLKT